MNDKLIFSKLNIIIFIVGIVILTLGYIIMSTGDITISPILLVIAYLIIFPLAILIGTIKKGKNEDKENPQE